MKNGNVFTVIVDQFDYIFLNKIINFLKKKKESYWLQDFKQCRFEPKPYSQNIFFFNKTFCLKNFICEITFYNLS